MNSASTARSQPISESARQVVDLSMKVLRAMKQEVVDDTDFAAPPQREFPSKTVMNLFSSFGI